MVEPEAVEPPLKRPLSDGVAAGGGDSEKRPKLDLANGSETARTKLKDEKEEERRVAKEKKEEEKRLLREQKEAERKAEKERKEAEKKAERERKEAERRAEKERKEAEKLSEKARKEEEKLLEKQRKEADKQAEKERKDLEKQAEKERKAKEQLKAQPRINLFFKSKAPAQAQAAPAEKAELPAACSAGVASSRGDSSSDYHRSFLPFHLKQNSQLFSGICNYTPKDGELDADPTSWLQQLGARSSVPCVATDKLSSQQFRTQLALAQESSEIARLLSRLRIRRLQYSHLSPKYIEDPTAPVNEEFRPPYVGSVQDVSGETRRQLAVDPFNTSLLESVAYEYDSEVEWDHEDGDDLRDEDGDDSDDEAEDQEDLREFLSSDEDDSVKRKPKVLGPLDPVLIWTGDSSHDELQKFSIQLLDGPINPLKTIPSAVLVDEEVKPASLDSIISPIQTKVGFDSLKASLVEHHGSKGTKTLIVELLKQRFPTATTQEIRGLFDSCLERVGKKRHEKMWVLNTEASKYFAVTELAPPVPGCKPLG